MDYGKTPLGQLLDSFVVRAENANGGPTDQRAPTQWRELQERRNNLDNMLEALQTGLQNHASNPPPRASSGFDFADDVSVSSRATSISPERRGGAAATRERGSPQGSGRDSLGRDDPLNQSSSTLSTAVAPDGKRRRSGKRAEPVGGEIILQLRRARQIRETLQKVLTHASTLTYQEVKQNEDEKAKEMQRMNDDNEALSQTLDDMLIQEEELRTTANEAIKQRDEAQARALAYQSKCEADEDEGRRLTAHVGDLQSEREGLLARIELITEKLKNTDEDLKHAATSRDQLREELDRVIQEQTEKILSLKDENDAAVRQAGVEKAFVEGQRVQLQNDLDALTAERAGLEERLADSDAKRAALEENFSRVAKERDDIDHESTLLQTRLQREVARLEDERNKLASDLASAKTTHDQEIAALREELLDSKSGNEEAMRKMQREADDLKLNNSRLQEDSRALESSVKKVETEEKTLENKLSAMETQMRALRDELDSANKARAEAERQTAAVQKELEAAKAK